MTNTSTSPKFPHKSVPNPVLATGFIPEKNEDLGAEITRLAGHINAAQYRFLKLLAALIERKAWGGDSGMKTPAHWLNYYCGIDLGAAREKVRVAKSLESLPLIDAAFSTGAISYSKVRAMTRTATPANEDYYLHIAKNGTASHVEILVRKHQRAERLNQGCQDKAQHDAREFSWFYDDDGMLVFRGKLPAEDGAVFLKAMEAMLETLRVENLQQVQVEPEQRETDAEDKTLSRKGSEAAPDDQSHGQCGNYTDEQLQNPLAQSQFTDQTATSQQSQQIASIDVSAETSVTDNAGEMAVDTCTQKRADALVLMSEHLLATLDRGPVPLPGGEKYQIMLHINANSQQGTEHAQCQLDNGACFTPLSSETMRRLVCDASLVTALEDAAGNVLNIGRKTRTVPPAIRRALNIRDRGCRAPGCCESRFVDAHHIRHWCDGGETSLDNLVLLCRHHHRLLHQGVISIRKEGIDSGSEAQLVFTNVAGRKIEYSLFPQFRAPTTGPEKTMEVEIANRELGLEIDSRTAITAWRGEVMDYAMAVEALLGRGALGQ
ncbi:MAG: DUF222 domain-containing protein [Proteobacteria bacterium]|nr:DUF222 domain-containing protein [Pseudomonadota bacterium]